MLESEDILLGFIVFFPFISPVFLGGWEVEERMGESKLRSQTEAGGPGWKA